MAPTLKQSPRAHLLFNAFHVLILSHGCCLPQADSSNHVNSKHHPFLDYLNHKKEPSTLSVHILCAGSHHCRQSNTLVRRR